MNNAITMHLSAIRILPLIVVVALLATPAGAVSLAESVSIALERHPAGAERRTLLDLADGYRTRGNSLLGGDPSLDIATASDSLGSDFGYEEYAIGIALPLASPRQRHAHRALADDLEQLSASAFARLRWEVAGEVLARAWRLEIAASDAREALKQWAGAQALESDIKHRYEAGELARNDLLLAQQDVLDKETGYQEALGARERARLAWQNYTGLDQLPDDLAQFSMRKDVPPLEAHPRLVEALDRKTSFAARAAMARALRRAAPVVSIYSQRDRGSRPEAYTDSIGIELSLPLGTRSQAAPAIAEAEAERATAETDAMLLQRRLALQIHRANQEVANSRELLTLANAKATAAEARLHLAQRAFELGEMNLYQLLLARQQAARSTRELRRRELEAQRAIAIRNHLSGAIPQ